jgi:hypothetical protein
MVQKNGKCGIIDLKGNWVVPCDYEYLSDMGDPVYRIKKNGKLGLLDKTANKEILTDFDEMNYFSGGLALVAKGHEKYRYQNKRGYIDYTGKLVVPMEKLFQGCYFIDGEALVAKVSYIVNDMEETGKGWFIDTKGNKVKNPIRQGFGRFESEGACNYVIHRDCLMVLCNNTFFNSNGAYHVSYYLVASRPNGDLISVSVNDNMNKFKDPSVEWYVEGDTLYHYSGKTVKLQYGPAKEKTTGADTLLASSATINGKGAYGYVNTKGEIAIPFDYVYSEDFDYRGLGKVVKPANEAIYIQYRKEQDAIERAKNAPKPDLNQVIKAVQDEANRIEANRPKVKCKYCNGTGTRPPGTIKERCGFCGGAGASTCGSCGGSGWRSANAHCSSCNGNGRKTCWNCNGKGYTESEDSSDTKYKYCDGTGMY